MTAKLRVNEETDDLILLINDEVHATWSFKACVEEQKTSTTTHRYVAYSVVQQMLRDAYKAGMDKAAPQLAKIHQILKENPT